MPAPAAFSRRQFPGAAADTTITGAINSSVTACVLASAAGWPTGAFTGGILCELYSTTTGATAEKVWATDLTGTTLTIVRAADGTAAASHSVGTGIRPVAGAVDADEANKAVSETVGQVTTAGDLLVADGANSMTRLAKGANGEVLAMVAGSLDWTTVPAAAIAANTITNAMMADDSVDSDEIVDGAVDTVHIGDDQVTLAKMAAAAKPRWMLGPFTRNVVSGDGAMGLVTGSGPPQVPIPEACAVVGVSFFGDAARTAGSATAAVTINGSTTGFAATIDDDPTQYATAAQAETADAVAAGERIGVTFDTTGLTGPASVYAFVLLQAV